MPRRKNRKRPAADDEIVLEDTQEMWTVRAGEDDERIEGDDAWFEEEGEPGSDDRFTEDEEFTEDEALGENEQFPEDEVFGEDEEFPEDEGFGEEEFPEDRDGWYEESSDDGEAFGDGPETEPDETAGAGAAQPGPAPDRPSGRSLGDRLSAINFPDIPEPDPRHLLAGVGVLAIALLAGFGAYRLGSGSGQDLDSARIEGEAAGREAGAIEGASRGYPAGYREGREKGFARAYRRTYRIHYRRAFEQAGLDVPKVRDIDVPAP